MHPATPVIDEDLQRHENLVAKDQEEYLALPTLVINLPEGVTLLSRWELTDKELEQIKETRSVYVFQRTFGRPMQPLWLSLNADGS